MIKSETTKSKNDETCTEPCCSERCYTEPCCTGTCCISFDEMQTTIVITQEKYNAMKETIERQNGQIEVLRETVKILIERLGSK